MISTQPQKYLLVFLLGSLFDSSHAEQTQLRGETKANKKNTVNLTPPTLLGTGTKRQHSPTNNVNLRRRQQQHRRLLDEGNDWCPEHFPGSDTPCSLTGSNYGTCYYSSPIPYHYIYDPHACSCNHDGTSTFSCWKTTDVPFESIPSQDESTEESVPFVPLHTNAPIPNNKNSSVDGSWCPSHFPGDNAACALSGMYVGTCYWSSSAQEGEMPNTDAKACSCNLSGTSRFSSCRDLDSFPGAVATTPPATVEDQVLDCPQFYPGSDTACSLTGMWVGTCFWSSSHQAGEYPNNNAQECSCNQDGTSKFSCQPKNN